jgi:tetratricopeptide (TPR) repeat protein
MDHSEILAFHYGQALELAKTSGKDDDRGVLEDRARRFLLMSGDRAVGLDPLTAESYYRQALDLVPANSPDRPEVLVKSGEAAALHGDLQTAESLLQEAIDGFGEDGQRAVRAAATKVSLFDVVRDRGEIARARRILDDALRVLERDPPGPELARAYVARARDGFLSGRTEQSQEWSEKALVLC